MNDLLAFLRTALADRYAIERELGAGGMATVYLAEDIRHRRRVAVKVLRPELAAILGAERFLKEIEVTANLQHPHLLPLFDSGEANGQLYYVMPHVEGESLRDLLRREKQLPVDVAVRWAVQIASALDYAHRHGVIHRDIKPENVLIHEGEALVADFGIALALRNAGASRLTETGLSLGTPQYMSPEQAMGDREIDARSDVYSLGAMLYEMLAGDPPYTGSTAQAIVARVITEKAPSLSAARDTVPRHVAAAVARALAKLPADRFRTAAEFAHALQHAGDAHADAHADATGTAAAAAGGGGSRAVLRSPVARVLGGVALVAVGAALALLLRPRPDAEPAPPVRATLELPGDVQLENPALDFSGDGKILWVNVRQDGVNRILRRRLDGAAFEALAGSEGALQHFASHDGRWVGFRAASGGLMKLAGDGGTPVIVDADAKWGYGDWGADGTLYYSRSYVSGIWRVAADRGTPERLTSPDTAAGELAHWHPQLLPDGKHLLFTVFRTPIDSARVEVLSLEDGTRTVVQRGAVSGRYVPTGHLLFARREVLFAVPFDARTLRTRGSPVPVVDNVAMRHTDGIAFYAVSDQGTLAYLSAADVSAPTELVWVDRKGSITPALRVDAVLEEPELSPDGRFVALSRTDPGESQDVWVADLTRGTLTRVTSGGGADFNPIWFPDGRRLAYIVESPIFQLYEREPTGGAPARVLLRTSFDKFPSGFTPDGSQLVFEHGLNPHAQVWRLDLASGRADTLLSGPREVNGASVSPDGRWLAHQSGESGRTEIFLVSYPDVTRRRQQVSVNGGISARWTRGGRELVYRNGRQVLAVTVDPATGEPGAPVVLFDGDLLYSPSARSPNYDVTPDGSRFLMVRRQRAGRTERVHVVTNWFAELRAKAP